MGWEVAKLRMLWGGALWVVGGGLWVERRERGSWQLRSRQLRREGVWVGGWLMMEGDVGLLLLLLRHLLLRYLLWHGDIGWLGLVDLTKWESVRWMSVGLYERVSGIVRMLHRSRHR